MRRAFADTPDGQIHYRAPGGTVAMVDQMPEAFAAAIRGFLRGGP